MYDKEDIMTLKAIGIGTHLPGPQISNKQISKRFSVNEEWINYFVGTKYRHFSVDLLSGEPQCNLTDIATQAAQNAIENAGIETQDIDVVIMASATPDHLMPATVNLVADRLGLNKVATYHLQSGCAGAIQAIDLGMRILNSGQEHTALVIGADVCNKFMDFSQDFSQLTSKEIINYVLFGDGAGSLVLQKTHNQKGIYIDGVINQFVGRNKKPGQMINWWGQSKPVHAKGVLEDYKAIELEVPPLTKELMHELLNTQRWKLEELNYFLVPQLSKTMTEKIIHHLQIPMEKSINCVEMTGNNGNALPFIQLNQIFHQIQKNEKGLILAIESSKWIKAGMVFHA